MRTPPLAEFVIAIIVSLLGLKYDMDFNPVISDFDNRFIPEII